MLNPNTRDTLVTERAKALVAWKTMLDCLSTLRHLESNADALSEAERADLKEACNHANAASQEIGGFRDHIECILIGYEISRGCDSL